MKIPPKQRLMRNKYAVSFPVALHDEVTDYAKSLGYTFSGYLAELMKADTNQRAVKREPTFTTSDYPQ